MNPAFDAPFLPNPFAANDEPAPAPKADATPDPTQWLHIDAVKILLAVKDTEIARLQEKLNSLTYPPAPAPIDWLKLQSPPGCIPSTGEPFRFPDYHGICIDSPSPGAAPLHTTEKSVACQYPFNPFFDKFVKEGGICGEGQINSELFTWTRNDGDA
jgi:hypothetical protein